MKKYRCKVCGYIETSFEELPDDYKCPVCGAAKDQFEMIHHLGEEQTGGEAQEKHVPVLEVFDGGVRVKVGSVPHPMEEAHYITKVELYDGEAVLKKIDLKAGQEPIAVFEGVEFEDSLHALAYCNIHGIWES